MTKLLLILMVFVLHTPSWSITGDLDRDRDGDFDDFFLFSDNFGKTGEVETFDCGEDSITGGDERELSIWINTYDNRRRDYQYYINLENNKKVKHRWFNSYYWSGEYWEVGTYKEDRRDGEWTYYTEDGRETTGVYDNGRKDSIEFWINVKHDILGRWVETEDELKQISQTRKNVYRGLFAYENGLGVLYWKNGNVRSEGLYKDGKNEGYYQTFHTDGDYEEIGTYKENKRDGDGVTFYS